MITDIYIEPVDATFDIAGVGAFLIAQPNTGRDAVAPHIYMIAASEEELAAARQARVADAVRFPMTVILVDVCPAQIMVAYRTAETAPARRFVAWLQTNYTLRFHDETFAALPADLDYLFG